MSSPNFTILLVSPDRVALRRLSKFLDVFGYDVRQATGVDKALIAAEAARPDFLILDGSASQPANLQLAGAIRRIWPAGYIYSFYLSDGLEPGDITAALEAGFDDFLAAPLVFGELLARLRAGARVIEFERRLGAQSGVDALTGLADAAALSSELRCRSQVAQGAIGWLALLQIDYFGRIANQHGRGGAEEVSKQVAQHLSQRLTPEHFAAALGDDRFAILLPVSGSETAAAWCEQTLASLSEPTFSAGAQEYPLTASCGLREIAAGESLDDIQAGAERALQLARSSGRDCVVRADEVQHDAEEWAAFAADGNLFATTLARDVMHPCPLLLPLDETLDQAFAILSQTGLTQAPVVDGEQKLAGLVSLDQLAAARLRQPKPRASGSGSSSVRLVRHIMTTAVSRFEEETPLAELMQFFTDESATLAVIVQDKKPRGLVHCHALAALNERLTVGQFVAAQPRTGTSADLLVPDLALAE